MNSLVGLKAPISVNLEVTEQCNLKCFFCFCSTEEYEKSLPILPTSAKIKNLKDVLQILKEKEIFEIRFFGGEFSLLHGWRDLLEYACSLDFFISFVSNGTIFQRDDVDFLAKMGISSCSISLHGIGSLHDKIVGVNGSFERAIRNIDMLRKRNVNVVIPFTPNKSNLSHFEAFAKQMINVHGVSSVGINRLFHSERYENLKIEDYVQLLDVALLLQKEGLPIFFVDSFPKCKVPVKYWQLMNSCSQGVSFCQVDFLGNIKNCSSLCVNLGNVLTEDIGEIWKNKLLSFRQLAHLPLSCRLCPVFCGGGCIASRTINANFTPDEFIKRPNEETLYEAVYVTLKNYLKRFSSIQIPVLFENQKKWDVLAKPTISHRYKLRKEDNDKYLCMVESRGLFVLNNKSAMILQKIDGNRTIKGIKDELGFLDVETDDIVEVLNIVVA